MLGLKLNHVSKRGQWASWFFNPLTDILFVKPFFNGDFKGNIIVRNAGSLCGKPSIAGELSIPRGSNSGLCHDVIMEFHASVSSFKKHDFCLYVYMVIFEINVKDESNTIYRYQVWQLNDKYWYSGSQIDCTNYRHSHLVIYFVIYTMCYKILVVWIIYFPCLTRNKLETNGMSILLKRYFARYFIGWKNVCQWSRQCAYL